ncbi:MAG: UvrD-helicase domain-containing protein [Gammaproteobacteria bacterium]
MNPPDQSQRNQALDVTQSFIVQAPAGSGKTELLTRRFIALLNTVKNPEEILAITFTRKAAAEMQERILQALPSYILPGRRLRIQTIDAFCASLAGQMPVLEDADVLYTYAAHAVLASLEENQPWSDALAELLLHLDNDFVRTERLFIDMLARRDQWLPYLDINTDLATQRNRLEASLKKIIQENTDALAHCFPPQLLPILWSHIPENDWTAAAAFLLTKNGTWRKRGVPEALKGVTTNEALFDAFIRFRHSPPAQYAENQWRILTALLTLLPVLVAHLRVTFETYTKVDHAEIALSALQALGDIENPSDLALRLDYRIQHILVDEFQDTSALQFQLLEKLTAGWQPNDGRTLFFVGDPMQSIYRFRKAEVGLFLHARHYGIGSVPLHPLTLSANFRSQQGVVHWINAVFPEVFPSVENISAGAVAYTPSFAIHPPEYSPAVSYHNCEVPYEPDKIIGIIQQHAKHHIGILVRSRTHLEHILPALRAAHIPYRAIDVDPLADRAVIQDLLILTRFLRDTDDYVAKLALLRAPWCGLMLSDLYAIAHQQPLSAEGQQQFDQTMVSLAPYLAQRDAVPLHRLVEQSWLALEGPAYCQERSELDDATLFFNHLAKLHHAQIPWDIPRLEKQLTKLYAAPDMRPDIQVEIMSLHKAKGLEFDTVIIPGLHRRARNDGSPLLMMGRDLLLAPITATADDSDLIYQYIRRLETQKSHYEIGRLLYVGATRARKTLHLLGHCDPDRKPANNSLLAVLGDMRGRG